MLILVLLCENERQRWDASLYIKASSEAKVIITDIAILVCPKKLQIIFPLAE